MKKYIIIISLILGVSCFAQTNNFQQEEFLSQFGTHFESVEMTETGIIRLQAKESFTSLSAERKSIIMEFVLSRGYTLAFVTYEYKRELWQRDTSGTAVLLDSWDLNILYTPRITLKTLQKTDVHPWFLQFGLNSSFNEDLFNLNLTGRIGFFLLKNRWDLALSYSFRTNLTEFNDVTTSDLGLMSRVYFPIQKYNIAPYAGLGISYVWSETYTDYADFSTTTSWHVPLYLGVSWFVGPGSLDFGLQISSNTVFTVGYTFSPNKLLNRK
jgi:hypothetical protein